ncbi:MAG: response regulator PleD [Myxococcota bacterium]
MPDVTQAGGAARPRLLFVDDDVAARRAFARTMGPHSGFEVALAASAEEALAVTRPDEVSVVVTDLVMPGTSGLSLIRQWHRVAPATTFVIVTGTPKVALDVDRSLDAFIMSVVNKPWDRDGLLEVFRHALMCSQRRARATLRRRSNSSVTSLGWDALVVEDDPADARLLEHRLRDHCTAVVHRQRLDDALTELRRRRFGFVFVDLTLPDARGLDCVRQVKRAAPDSVLVVHTGHDDEGLEVQALELGAQEVWRKGQDDARVFARALRLASARKRAERKLTQLAHRDALTGLTTRGAFHDRLAHTLALARRRGDSPAVLFIDLDGFKAVNDELGHEAGDQLLRVVAQRLRASVREADTVARLGGDEFAVLLQDAGAGDVVTPTQRIIEALARRIQVGARKVRVTASVGIATYPMHGEDPAALLRAADTAMYDAKRAGKSRYSFAPIPQCAGARRSSQPMPWFAVSPSATVSR